MAFPPSDRWVLEFDGTDDKVQLPGRGSPSNFTLAVDFYAFDFSPNFQLLVGTADYSCGLWLGLNKIYADFNSTETSNFYYSILGNASLETNTWYRAVFTYNGSVMRVYLNGNLDHSINLVKTVYTGTDGNGFIGGDATNEFPANAQICNVRLWSVALSEEQVADLDAQTSNLVRSYALDEGTGTTATNAGSDSSANGTITGATWVFLAESEIIDVRPDQIVAATNLKDSNSATPPVQIEDLQDDPDSPDAYWWDPVNVTLGIDVTWGFPAPSGELTGNQEFEILVAKTTGAPHPKVTAFELREEGIGLLASLGSVGVEITSTTGQILSGTASSALITDPSKVQIRLACDPG